MHLNRIDNYKLIDHINCKYSVRVITNSQILYPVESWYIIMLQTCLN